MARERESNVTNEFWEASKNFAYLAAGLTAVQMVLAGPLPHEVTGVFVKYLP